MNSNYAGNTNMGKAFWCRNRKRKNIDGFFVAHADKEEIGLPYDILLDSIGAERRFAGKPHIWVTIDEMVIPVPISEEPVVLSGYVFQHSDDVLAWVKKNHEVLIMHWFKEISDREVLELLSKHSFS